MRLLYTVLITCNYCDYHAVSQLSVIYNHRKQSESQPATGMSPSRPVGVTSLAGKKSVSSVGTPARQVGAKAGKSTTSTRPKTTQPRGSSPQTTPKSWKNPDAASSLKGLKEPSQRNARLATATGLLHFIN